MERTEGQGKEEGNGWWLKSETWQLAMFSLYCRPAKHQLTVLSAEY